MTSFVTDLKLCCFSEPTRERGRHDVVIRLRGHKSILQLVSAVSSTISEAVLEAWLTTGARDYSASISIS